jgi:glycosyltransferase involved in cell wall biosynthesis
MLRVCTIIARNYWAHARVLARSLREHNPSAHLAVLVVDPDPACLRAAEREEFEVVVPSDLGIEQRELNRMAGIYNVLELSTALKPALLRTLLARDEPVAYLDPDIEVFGSLEEAAEGAEADGLVLTPHVLGPLPLTEYGPNELTFLQSGIYNLGFVAVGPKGKQFLDWWDERLRRHCLISKEEGMFVDQRWVDLSPAFFTPRVITDPGWNVAYWNLSTRRLSHGRAGYEVEGSPLRFFHFSGFDPHDPSVLSRFLGPDPEIDPPGDPVLAELCSSYADKVMRAGHRAHSLQSYPLDHTPGRLELDSRSRRLYRRELIKSESRRTPEPPNPFEDDDAFVLWLNAPQPYDTVSRYLRLLYEETPELKASFPDLLGGDAIRFLDWVRQEGAEVAGIPEPLVPRWRPPSVSYGANVAGYVEAESGVGELARSLVRALDSAGIDLEVVPYASTKSRQLSDELKGRFGDPKHPASIVCVNADQIPYFLEDEGARLEGSRIIGYWSWEVERMPEWMGKSAGMLDEIWTLSSHAASAVREWTDEPVYVLPPPVVAPAPPPSSRSDLGLPEGFVFLFSFDFDSVFERKNPLGVVEAFTRAFPRPGEASLVIKSVRGEAHPEKLSFLKEAVSGRPDIVIKDGYLARDSHDALVASCDAFVSLHRGEGFGLHMAEAMALGKPVVATGYSGNLEFMDETNSYLVGFDLVPIPSGCDPYPSNARWAEPPKRAAARRQGPNGSIASLVNRFAAASTKAKGR